MRTRGTLRWMSAPGRLFSAPEDRYLQANCALYLQRILAHYRLVDPDTLEFLAWVLEGDVGDFCEAFSHLLHESTREAFQADLAECGPDPDDLGRMLDHWVRIGAVRRKALVSLMFGSLDRIVRNHASARRCRMDRNFAALCALFDLKAEETDLCRFLYITATYRYPERFFSGHLNACEVSGFPYLACALDVSRDTLHRMIEGALSEIGMIECEGNRLECEPHLMRIIHSASRGRLKDHFFRPLAREDVPIEYHDVDLDIVQYLLELLKSRTETPSHILLYGPPGSGKTSFARALLAQVGLPAYEANHTVSGRLQSRKSGIVASLKTTRKIKGGGLLLIDEAEDLLNTESFWAVKGAPEEKAWLNQLMDEPGNKCLWITNRVDDIDPSTKRRFALSLEFKRLGRKERMRQWDRVLRRNRLKRRFSAGEIEALSERYDVSVGVMDLCLRKAVESGAAGKAELDRRLRCGLDAHAALQGDRERAPSRLEAGKEFILDGLNLSKQPEDLVAMVACFRDRPRELETRRATGLNMLFYGPPGTGKTELAHYLAHHADLSLISRTAGELLDPYLGMTERRLAEAFAEAEKERGILLLDEADTFLFSRDRAVRSWEVSMTNELLTQMERFCGILICTTNRLPDLDEASLRRFTAKVEFGFLAPEAVPVFYERYFKPLTGAVCAPEMRRRVSRIAPLAPGDFKTVRDRFAWMGTRKARHEALIQALEEEASLKTRFWGKKTIGF